MNNKPTRCISPIIKLCQECPWGWTHYPEWVETSEDLAFCTVESGCMLGYDQGRLEDEPTAEELKEFEEWCFKYELPKSGYCPICDEVIYKHTDDSMCNCPTCGHHVNLYEED